MFAFSLWRPKNNNNKAEASRSKNCTIKYRNAFKEPRSGVGGSTTIFIGLFSNKFKYVFHNGDCNFKLTKTKRK